MKIVRDELLRDVLDALRRSRCVGLAGPRQCGKSTLAREIAHIESATAYFDLEDPSSEARLRDPKLALEPLRGLVVIDEVQRRPDLFPLLRVLLDREPLPSKFLLLGSASPELLRGASESLAGRIEFLQTFVQRTCQEKIENLKSLLVEALSIENQGAGERKSV